MAAGGSSSSSPAVPTPESARRRLGRRLFRVGRIVVAVVVVWLVLRLIRGIDWHEVGYAVTHLAAWQAVTLVLGVVLCRAVLAGPLALLVSGLSYPRAVANDVAASAVAMIAPTPSDVVIRLAMFRSWGVDITAATSGLTLSTLLLYFVRLAAPLLGFVVFWIWRAFYAPFGWSALVFGCGAALLLGGLLYAVRAADTAAAIGRLIGRLLHRIRPASQGPDAWGQRLVDFQSHSAARMRQRGDRATLCLIVALGIETAVLIACIGFVGVRLDGPTIVLLACSFLVSYPLTGLPLMGAGVLDATFVAFVIDHSAIESTDLVAALILWRVAVQVVPVVAGLLTVAWWRRTTAAVPESA